MFQNSPKMAKMQCSYYKVELILQYYKIVIKKSFFFFYIWRIYLHTLHMVLNTDHRFTKQDPEPRSYNYIHLFSKSPKIQLFVDVWIRLIWNLTKKVRWSKTYKAYPVLIACLINPFLFVSVRLYDPGFDSNDSSAPPMTITAIFPLPFLVNIHSRLERLTSQIPEIHNARNKSCCDLPPQCIE